MEIRQEPTWSKDLKKIEEMETIDKLADSENYFKKGSRWFFRRSKRLVGYGLAFAGTAILTGYICHDAGRKKGEEEVRLEEEIQREILIKIQREKVQELEERLEDETKQKNAAEELRRLAQKNAEEYKKQWEAADALSNTYKKRIDEQTQRIGTLEKRISNLEEQIRTTSGALEDTQLELSRFKAKFDDYVVKYDDLNRKYQDKCTEYDNLKKRLDQIIKDYEGLQEDVKKKVQNSEAINNAMARDKERLEQEKKALEEEVAKSKTAHAELEAVKKDLQERYREAQRTIEAIETGKGVLEGRFTDISKKTQDQAEEIARLKRYSDELNEVLKKKSEEARMYEQRIEGIIQKHKQELQRQEEVHAAAVSRITTSYESEKARLIAQNEEAQKNIREGKDAMERLEDILKGFKKKVAEYEAQQKKDQETIGSQRTSIENLEKKVAQLEEETRVYRAQIETEQATNESKQKRIGELFQAIVEMKKTLVSETETKEKIQAKLEEIERLRTQLEEFKESMPREYKMLFSTRIAYIQNNSLYVTDGDPQVSNRIQMRNFPLFDSSTVELRRPRISPDRKYVAVEYRDSSKDKWGIRLYEIIEFFDGDIGRGKKGLLRRIEFNEDLSELAWIDNTNIAFIAGEKKDELWIYDINSEKPTCLVKNETGIIGDIAATPTGKYIAYVVFSEYEGKNACQIWGITPQGENRTRISSREDKYNMQPSWIDESTLVYTREGRSYDSEVCLVRLGSPTVKQTYRSVTSNASFPRSIVARNSADCNPAANMEGLVIFTNESDGIVVRHPKKSLQSGLLDKPDDMPYEQEDVIASEATNRHCRAQFYEDGRSILVKIKNRLYRVKKVNGEYQRQFIAEADEESDFDIR